MSNTVIYFFVKTFLEAAHADQFLDGLLYMNSLDYFVRLEETDGSGRGDRHEGVSHWFQPNEIRLELNGVKIDSADLAGPVVIRPDYYLTKNIFCMHAGYIGGNTPSEFATTDEFEQALKIPQENVSLGQISIVITNVGEFFCRLKNAVRRRDLSLRGGLVKYYDPETFSGHFDDEDALFNKQIRFAYQREYRLVIDRKDGDESPYVLDIGDLRDIAHIVPIEMLNAGIKISPIA